MPELTSFDTTDKGTLRPDEELLESAGDKFVLIKLPYFSWEIYFPEDVSLDDFITLFTIYYTPEIMDIIIKNTNNYARKPRNKLVSCTGANEWYPTCCKELYLYFAIRIYMTLVVFNEIFDYWNTTSIMPTHEITKWIARDRFQELYIRVRLAGMGIEGVYAKVSKALFISFLFFIKF
jgi:hypothetical protein